MDADRPMKIINLIKCFPFTVLDLESDEDIDMHIALCDIQLSELYKEMLKRIRKRNIVDNYLYWKVFRK